MNLSQRVSEQADKRYIYRFYSWALIIVSLLVNGIVTFVFTWLAVTSKQVWVWSGVLVFFAIFLFWSWVAFLDTQNKFAIIVSQTGINIPIIWRQGLTVYLPFSSISSIELIKVRKDTILKLSVGKKIYLIVETYFQQRQDFQDLLQILQKQIPSEKFLESKATTNKFSTWQNEHPYLAAIVVAGIVIAAIFIAQNLTNSPELTHYIVKVSSTVPDTSLEATRLALEESLFKSVNQLTIQNPTLTYSKALDTVLPMSVVASDSSSGVVIVVNNYGETTAHNVQVDIRLEAPFKEYKVFSSKGFSVIEEDQSKGNLKISVGDLAPAEKIRIAILLSGDYPVLITASRTEDLQAPVFSTSESPSMNDIEMFGTQTAVAVYNQNHVENLLQFEVQYAIDNIQPTILVSSDEIQSDFLGTWKNQVNDNNLFFETFPQ